MTKLYRGPVRGVPEGLRRRWWRRRGGGQGGEGLAGHGESRRCCGAAGRRCLTTVGRDRQGAAKTEESAIQQTRRMPRPFPTLAPRPAGTRRGNKNATEGPQQQKRSSRRATAAERPPPLKGRSEKRGRGSQQRQTPLRSSAHYTERGRPYLSTSFCFKHSNAFGARMASAA